MSITAKCTIENGMIKLPNISGIIDGTKVLVSIEPVKAKQNKKQIARELAGSWKTDNSIEQIFAEISEKRNLYYGREIEMLA